MEIVRIIEKFLSLEKIELLISNDWNFLAIPSFPRGGEEGWSGFGVRGSGFGMEEWLMVDV
jgi:hypothetical protein